MSDFLRLKFKTDTDGTGELFAEVHCRGFAGLSSAWFGEEQLIDFARRLAAAFPLQNEAPLTLTGGFWSTSGSGIEQLHVGLEFYPVGGTGQVGCRISLYTPVHDHDRQKSQSSVVVELQTNYARLGIFAKSLEMLSKGQTNEAILESEG